MSINKYFKWLLSSHITNIEGDSTSTTITKELYCKGELRGNVTHNCTKFQR